MLIGGKQCYQACYKFFEQLEANGFYALMEADGTSSQNYRDAFFKAYFERQNNTELLISTRVIGKFNNDWWYKFQN